MNSCLYKCTVMHNRMEPKKNKFHYNIFMFYLDLDEIDMLNRKKLFMSRNRFNLFNFRDSDHFELPDSTTRSQSNIKDRVTEYLKLNGITIGNGRIMLLTNLCTMGYIFNPVGFYYCYNEDGQLVCSVIEICNTFKELKVFFAGKNCLENNNKFHLNTIKHFYVSPFIELDTTFDFNLFVPGEKLNIKIDDYKDGKRFFISTLTGVRKELTDLNLLFYSLRFPLITLQIIILIHWQALILFLKKIPYHKKNANIHCRVNLCRNVFPYIWMNWTIYRISKRGLDNEIWIGCSVI